MPPAEQPKPQKSCLAVLMAMVLAVLVFAGLFMLTGGAILPAAVAGGVIFGVAALHYVVWGWWLSGLIHDQVREEEEKRS